MRISLANSRTRSTRAMVTTAVGCNQLIHLMKTARHFHMDDGGYLPYRCERLSCKSF